MTCPSSLCTRFNRPSLVMWIFFLGALVTLICLGMWQFERLAWKEALIARIEASGEANPVTELPKEVEALKALEFHHVALGGVYLPEREFHVTPRYFKEKLGYHIFTPFKLEDGRIVMVNRGWVPAAQKLAETREGSEALRGFVTVDGILRLRAERSPFTPDSQPEQNVWFGRDVMRMAEVAKLEDVIPVSIDIVGPQVRENLPVPSDGKIELRNDHLHYAITWFGIALGLVIVFLVYHHKGKNQS